MTEQDTEQREREDQSSGEDGREDEAAKAEAAKERYEQAEEKVKGLEEDPPTNLEDWPDDEAKYITLGGVEGQQSYDEGPTKNLGPHDLERHDDGSISIEGEKVDNPDEYK